MNRRDFVQKLLLSAASLAVYKRSFSRSLNINEMKTLYHPASTRGTADFGWLKANYSFSFANYYDPSRMHFGVLRVLNDDVIAPGKGFGTHPHDNMEIVTIPLEGALEHKDSLGSVGVIRKGEIQVMSAGTGVQHSEYNHSKDEEVKVLQTWVFPREKGIKPRYDQKRFTEEGRNGKFQLIISPDGRDGSLVVHQDAFYSLADFKSGTNTSYSIHKPGNGVYVFVMEGSLKIGEQKLNKRDALGVSEIDKFVISVEEDCELLLIEVPMAL